MTTELNPIVVSNITDAVNSYGSTYNSLQFAAEAAASELNTAAKPAEAIEAVLNRYTTAFDGNHNLKAIFKDLLTLHYADDLPHSYTDDVRGEDGEVEKVERHTTAGVAAGFPKHKMRDAAKEVRAHYGLGRKIGGGRTASSKPGDIETLTGLITRVLQSDSGVAALKLILNPLGFNIVSKPVK